MDLYDFLNEFCGHLRIFMKINIILWKSFDFVEFCGKHAGFSGNMQIFYGISSSVASRVWDFVKEILNCLGIRGSRSLLGCFFDMSEKCVPGVAQISRKAE